MATGGSDEGRQDQQETMAERMGTSRSQLDRCSTRKTALSNCQTIGSRRRAVGRRLRMEMFNAA